MANKRIREIEGYNNKLVKLRKKLEECTHFEGKVPDSLVEAFFEKIWVSKDEFKWFLRIAGKKNQSDENRIEIASFTVTFEDAKAFLYSNSPKRRVYNWNDFKVSLWM